MSRVLVIASLPESLVGFRRPLLEALLACGHAVHVAAPDLPPSSVERRQLERMGVRVHEVSLRRVGTNPLMDLTTLIRLWQLMLRIRPSHVLGYTIKPVVYGLLAARLARVPHRFALITGLGYAFGGEGGGSRGVLRDLVRRLYTLSLRGAHVVFFQNPDDQALFRSLGILSAGTPSTVVNGSGVGLDEFAVTPLPEGMRFLLIARLLVAKGVREYAQAAELVRQRHPDATFSLVGMFDGNPDAISPTELDGWVETGAIEYLGRMNDVRPAISACSVYVLPSYSEGTPRTVLEAMAMGRAIITTDAPGCRETVSDGVNGLLVPVRSVDELAAAMERLIREPALVARMGQCSREVAEDKYDVRKVNAMMLGEMGL